MLLTSSGGGGSGVIEPTTLSLSACEPAEKLPELLEVRLPLLSAMLQSLTPSASSSSEAVVFHLTLVEPPSWATTQYSVDFSSSTELSGVNRNVPAAVFVVSASGPVRSTTFVPCADPLCSVTVGTSTGAARVVRTRSTPVNS